MSLNLSLDVNRSAAAALALLLWDTVISFSEEVELVWSLSNAFWIKWVFLFNRYFTICIQSALMYQRTNTLHTPSSCRGWYHLRALARPILLASVQTTLIARVRALYDRKRWVTVCMLVVFGLQVISAAVAGAILLPRISVDATCFPANNDTLRVIYDMVTIMPPLALEVLMFILTTCMAQKTARDLGWNSQIPLLKLLIRDGSWACILVFGIVVVNIVLQTTQGGVLAWAGVDWLMTLISFASTRLILNMLSYAPRAGARPADDGYSTAAHARVFTSHVEYAFDIGRGTAIVLPIMQRKTWMIEDLELK